MRTSLRSAYLSGVQNVIALYLLLRRALIKKSLNIETRLSDIIKEREVRQKEFRIIEDKIVIAENGLVPLLEKERELSDQIMALEKQEQEGANADRKRAFEYGRWEIEQRRRTIIESRWNIVQSLLGLREELQAKFAQILELENTEAMLEAALEHRPRAERKAPVTVTPIDREELAKKHISPRDTLRLSLRMFKVKPGMTVLTILGIGVSFATIFVLVSLGYGLEKILLGQISSASSLKTIEVASPNLEVTPITEELAERIRNIPRVSMVHTIARLTGHAEIAGLVAETEIHGVDMKFFEDDTRLLGEFSGAGVVISAGLASLYGQNSPNDILGQEIAVTARSLDDTKDIVLGTYPISGIIRDDEQVFVVASVGVFPPSDTRYEALTVITESPNDVPSVRTSITDMGLLSTAIADTVEQASQIFQVVEIALALFGASALIVATIGMVNTMTVSLLERTQEIGIMKILGVADRDVRELFLTESTIMGLLGGISGISIGYAATHTFNFFVNMLAGALGGAAVELFYAPAWFVVAIFLSATIIGLFTGAVPSRRAARMDPLEALKYK